MDITLPSGKVLKGVPDGTPKDMIKQKAIASGQFTEQDFAMPTEQPSPAPMEERLPVELQEPPMPTPTTPSMPSQEELPPSYGERAGEAVAQVIPHLRPQTEFFVDAMTDPATVGQIAGGALPGYAPAKAVTVMGKFAPLVYRWAGSILGGTSANEAAESLGLTNKERSVAQNLGMNTAEVTIGELGAKALRPILRKTGLFEKKVTQDLVPTEEAGTTVREAGERLGVDVIPAEAYEKALPEKSYVERLLDDTYQAERKITGSSELAKRDKRAKQVISNVFQGKNTQSNLAEMGGMLKTRTEDILKTNKANIDSLTRDIQAEASRSQTRYTGLSESLQGAIKGQELDLIDAMGSVNYGRLQKAVAELGDAPTLKDVMTNIADIRNTFMNGKAGEAVSAVALKQTDDGIPEGFFRVWEDFMRHSDTVGGKLVSDRFDAIGTQIALESNPVVKKALTNPKLLVNRAFTSVDDYNAFKGIYSKELSKDEVDGMLRGVLMSKLKGGNVAFTESSMRKAMTDVSPEVMKEVLGDSVFKSFGDAMALNMGLERVNLMNAALSRDLDDTVKRGIFEGLGRATGVAPLGSYTTAALAFTRKFREFAGIDKGMLESLSDPKHFKQFEELSRWEMSNPKAYTAYKDFVRGFGVNPISEDAFRAAANKTYEEQFENKE